MRVFRLYTELGATPTRSVIWDTLVHVLGHAKRRMEVTWTSRRRTSTRTTTRTRMRMRTRTSEKCTTNVQMPKGNNNNSNEQHKMATANSNNKECRQINSVQGQMRRVRRVESTKSVECARSVKSRDLCQLRLSRSVQCCRNSTPLKHFAILKMETLLIGGRKKQHINLKSLQLRRISHRIRSCLTHISHMGYRTSFL